MSPEGLRNGECLSGRENIFACRPHPGTSPSGPVTEAGTRLKAGQGTGPSQEERTPTAANGQPDTGITQPLTTKPVVPDNLPAKPAAAPRIDPAPPPQSEISPDRQSTTHSALIDTFTESLGSNLAVALATGLLTWYLCYRHSTVPLRRLRNVTQQLATGNLSARVGEGLVHQKNEVADLARDVDRMAERIESLVGAHQRLIRDVSHELRSPLARLNVALELARQSAGPTHSAPFDRIERESERLNELIGQLLMLTKLESDDSMSQRADVDIAALVSEVVQDVDFEVSSNDRRVVVTGTESLALNGNKELLRQALENLVRNAARYTAAGTAVEISLRRKESGGRSWAHIEVRDQGPGVPEEELFDIFRPFYRVSDSRERQSGGTGVGLSISDRAVRLHGGRLRAFNAPGSGLIMEMELPLA
jgi:two-component system sensor histidine kinase CpxA